MIFCDVNLTFSDSTELHSYNLQQHSVPQQQQQQQQGFFAAMFQQQNPPAKLGGPSPMVRSHQAAQGSPQLQQMQQLSSQQDKFYIQLGQVHTYVCICMCTSL